MCIDAFSSLWKFSVPVLLFDILEACKKRDVNGLQQFNDDLKLKISYNYSISCWSNFQCLAMKTVLAT